ncbi:hypothetical protein A2997_01605 [Candidatus Nomurabacteria bacterium RIFCSPLOWO2_01_FULL_36_10b]|uniref:Sialidase domain-containing protein n=1 Tax=Candidatus Nomurabacteria bacterium RIFCSPLOWO2_01_FULL_36_10b TaxID=1801766 RepID=A0A1F6WND4_9BACT|nr:MAG: hypothetical protein A2997_01605 [Candidatus Nomurabacteria bacterium RIFCSPLOWO2_01_FULL_36_10b]
MFKSKILKGMLIICIIGYIIVFILYFIHGMNTKGGFLYSPKKRHIEEQMIAEARAQSQIRDSQIEAAWQQENDVFLAHQPKTTITYYTEINQRGAYEAIRRLKNDSDSPLLTDNLFNLLIQLHFINPITQISYPILPHSRFYIDEHGLSFRNTHGMRTLLINNTGEIVYTYSDKEEINKTNIFLITGSRQDVNDLKVKVWVSHDLLHWEDCNTCNEYYYPPVVFKDKFITIANDEDGRSNHFGIYTSLDGKHWVFVNIPPWWAEDNMRPGFQMISDGNKLLVLGGRKTLSYTTGAFETYTDAWKSYDGVYWERITSDTGLGRIGNFRLEYFNNHFVITAISASSSENTVNERGSNILYSDDGSEWIRDASFWKNYDLTFPFQDSSFLGVRIEPFFYGAKTLVEYHDCLYILGATRKTVLYDSNTKGTGPEGKIAVVKTCDHGDSWEEAFITSFSEKNMPFPFASLTLHNDKLYLVTNEKVWSTWTGEKWVFVGDHDLPLLWPKYMSFVSLATY